VNIIIITIVKIQVSNLLYFVTASAIDRIYPRVNKVKEGSLATFYCYNNGRVYWNVSNVIVPHIKAYNGQVLRINLVKINYGGFYYCKGWDNIYNEQFEVSAELMVIGKPLEI